MEAVRGNKLYRKVTLRTFRSILAQRSRLRRLNSLAVATMTVETEEMDKDTADQRQFLLSGDVVSLRLLFASLGLNECL